MKILLPLLLLAACASSHSQSSFATAPAACSVQPQLAGEWRDWRMSQLGPARMVFSFGCDCRYTTHAFVALTRIAEEGQYRVENGSIVLSRATGETTTWPYRFVGEKLVLEEAAGETHEYTRTKSAVCR
jgi:hypothetical protein